MEGVQENGDPARKPVSENGFDEIELSLGLSCNGRFGVDPTTKRLKRSSSVANFVSAGDGGGRGRDSRAVVREVDSSELTRAFSLPVEAGEAEEGRRRKEVQSVRRMEARKKRMEKLRKVPSPQGSGGSTQASGGSCVVSETRSSNEEGPKQNVEVKSPSGVQPLPDRLIEPRPVAIVIPKNPNDSMETQRNAMLDMPFVSTKVEGQNGQKIDGFLYRYKRGDDVRIVCVCHGYFLSPAEFVKHGGGGDVENPLKHIVVNSTRLL